jgi:hypothetical protein
MMRSVLALAALLAFTVSAGVAFACSDPPFYQANKGKQTVASADSKSKPVVVPKSDKDG